MHDNVRSKLNRREVIKEAEKAIRALRKSEPISLYLRAQLVRFLRSRFSRASKSKLILKNLEKVNSKTAVKNFIEKAGAKINYPSIVSRAGHWAKSHKPFYYTEAW